MDEPSSGLDPASRKDLWKAVKSAKQERTIILTSKVHHFISKGAIFRLGDCFKNLIGFAQIRIEPKDLDPIPSYPKNS